MFKILTGFITDAESLVIAAINILAIIFVGYTWWRTKALASTLGSLLFAAVIVFGVNNIDTLSEDVEKDVNDRRNATSQADPRASED